MRRWWALALLVLSSCSWVNDPHAVAEAYLAALSKLDFAGAAQLVTEEGRDSFVTLSKVYASLPADEQKKFEVGGWTVSVVVVTGDVATADFTFDNNKKGQLLLRRVNGWWKVDHRRTF